MTDGERIDGQWSPLDGYQSDTRRRAVDPCGECHHGECRCEDDGSRAAELEAFGVSATGHSARPVRGVVG